MSGSKTAAPLRNVITVGIAIAALTLGACAKDKKEGSPSQSTTATTVPIKRGGTLVVAISSTAGVLNPATTSNGGVHTNSEAMFNGLLAWDANNQLVGDLAETFSQAPDGKQADFKLRTGMTWHDGSPITAQDVDFSFRQSLLRYHSRTSASIGVALGVTGSSNAAVIPADAITMPDGPTGLTVRFKFVTPYFPFLRQLNVTEAPIIPKAVYEPCSVTTMGANATLGNQSGTLCDANNKPVGSGPFKFVSRDANKIEVEAFKQYHRPGLPYLDRIVFAVTPNVDDSLQADRATSGSVDIGTPTGPGLARFTGNTNYERATVPRGTGGSNCISTYAFNLWPKGMTAQTIAAKPLDAPYEHPIFKDPAVRKAIFLGVDRTGSFKKIDFEQGKLATAPFHSELFGYAAQQLPGNDSVNNDADVAAANTALDQAGWVDSNNDGTRDKGGVELAFDLTHFDTGSQADYGKQFVADMAKLKIKVTDRPLTNANQQTALSSRDYDMSIISYCNGDDPVIGVRRQYHSTQVTNTSFVNTAGYRSAAMDAAWDKAIASDNAGAQAAYRDVQAMAARDLPYIWVTETATIRVNRSICKGFNNNNTGLFVETAHCD